MKGLDQFINRKVVVLHKNNTIFQASMAMKENDIGCVVVADKTGYINVVVETSIVWATEQDSLKDIIGLMVANSMRRIPIVRHTARGRIKCVGFVSLDDLICQGAITINTATEIIKPQVGHKSKKTENRFGQFSDQKEFEFLRFLSQ
jgi:CBS domain-containing protein